MGGRLSLLACGCYMESIVFEHLSLEGHVLVHEHLGVVAIGLDKVVQKTSVVVLAVISPKGMVTRNLVQ